MENVQLMEQLPTEIWMHRLRPGSSIYLVKEQRVARAGYPWEPPEPGYRAGQFVVDFGYGQCQVWYVDGHGNGLDGKPLIRPLEGELPEAPWPSGDLERRSARLLFAALTERIEMLEARVHALEHDGPSYDLGIHDGF